jgi:hypothetical protein
LAPTLTLSLLPRISTSCCPGHEEILLRMFNTRCVIGCIFVFAVDITVYVCFRVCSASWV